MEHALGHVKRGDRDGLAAYFAGLIERLAAGGADVAAISAVTPHICIRELEKISPLPLVNIVKETGDAIRARGFRKVALFGTRFVVESRMFGMLDGIEVIVPDQVDAIHDAYMQTVHGETGGRAVLSEIARDLAGGCRGAGGNGPVPDLRRNQHPVPACRFRQGPYRGDPARTSRDCGPLEALFLVHHIEQRHPRAEAANVLLHQVVEPGLQIVGAPGDVRGDDHVLELPQGMALG